MGVRAGIVGQRKDVLGRQHTQGLHPCNKDVRRSGVRDAIRIVAVCPDDDDVAVYANAAPGAEEVALGSVGGGQFRHFHRFAGVTHVKQIRRATVGDRVCPIYVALACTDDKEAAVDGEGVAEVVLYLGIGGGDLRQFRGCLAADVKQIHGAGMVVLPHCRDDSEIALHGHGVAERVARRAVGVGQPMGFQYRARGLGGQIEQIRRAGTIVLPPCPHDRDVAVEGHGSPEGIIGAGN